MKTSCVSMKNVRKQQQLHKSLTLNSKMVGCLPYAVLGVPLSSCILTFQTFDSWLNWWSTQNTVYSLLICSPLRFTVIQRKIEDFWKKLSNSITKLIKKEYKWRDENTNRSRIQIKQNKKPKQRIQCKDCQHKFWRW